MNDEAPILVSQATAARILDSLELLEKQAHEELKRIGAKFVLDQHTGNRQPLIQQYAFYLHMAHDWPGTRELRQELPEVSDDQLLSAAKLFDILKFVHWARICVARGEDYVYLFSVALERLSAVSIKELVATWNLAAGRKRGGKASPKRKEAVVRMLETILREEGNLEAKDLWRLVGSSTNERYCQVDLDGEEYEFEKLSNRDLAIFRINPELGRQALKPQALNSTFYRWCEEARKNLAGPLAGSLPTADTGL